MDETPSFALFAVFSRSLYCVTNTNFKPRKSSKYSSGENVIKNGVNCVTLLLFDGLHPLSESHKQHLCSDSFARLDSDIVDYLYSKSHSRVARRGRVVRPPLLAPSRRVSGSLPGAVISAQLAVCANSRSLHRQECLNFRQGTKQKRRCCGCLLHGTIFPLELEQNAEKCHIQQMRKRDNPYDPKKQKVDIILSALRKNAAKINSNELKTILCIYT